MDDLHTVVAVHNFLVCDVQCCVKNREIMKKVVLLLFFGVVFCSSSFFSVDLCCFSSRFFLALFLQYFILFFQTRTIRSNFACDSDTFLSGFVSLVASPSSSADFMLTRATLSCGKHFETLQIRIVGRLRFCLSA